MRTSRIVHCTGPLIAASIALGFSVLPPAIAHAQSPSVAPERPRLVVALVIDQLRPDYLVRFREHFGEGGFNRFFTDGAAFPAARYAHAVTKTCAGHAVVLPGSHANTNGIIANSWYDPVQRREIYCALDDDASLLGVDGEGRSPRKLRVSTVGDELRLATGGRSKVVSVSGKDRAAIMMGGHLTDHVYWMKDTLVTSSTWYRDALPEWVREFNASGPVSRYFGTHWKRVLPDAAYEDLGPDDFHGETDEAGSGRTFPHPLGIGSTAIDGDFIEAWEHSPFPNEVVIELAMRAVVEEALGADENPDILGIGLSANDWVGHWFGPGSHEVLDVTVRTDRLLEHFFDFLDREIGLDHVLVVLTADHGVAPLPERVEALSPIGARYRIHPSHFQDAVTAALEAEYGPAGSDGWVLYHDAPYIYLNERALDLRGGAISDAERIAAAALNGLDAVHSAHGRTELERLRAAGVATPIVRSFHPAVSGHILYTTRPYVLVDDEATGTSHGSSWSYDVQVPLLWLGPGIRPGTYYSSATVADIAPTLSAILGLLEPGGSVGSVLREMVEERVADPPPARADREQRPTRW
jgi:predicted AlkP superfamily pyrophosphatase or phosphodiesterase